MKHKNFRELLDYFLQEDKLAKAAAKKQKPQRKVKTKKKSTKTGSYKGS